MYTRVERHLQALSFNDLCGEHLANAISRTGWNLKGFLRFPQQARVLNGTSGSCDLVHGVGLIFTCREGGRSDKLPLQQPARYKKAGTSRVIFKGDDHYNTRQGGGPWSCFEINKFVQNIYEINK